MKRLKDLEISVIKPQNHNSTKELDFILEEINSIIYTFYFLYINENSLNYIFNSFVKCGQILNVMELSDKQENRKKEILKTLRRYYKILKDYEPDNDENTIVRMNHYYTSQFLREKRELEGKESDEAEWRVFYINWLQKTKEFSKYYKIEKCLQSVNNEAINYFKID